MTTNYSKNDIQDNTDNIYRFCDYNNERSILSKALNKEDYFYTLLTRVKEADFLSKDTRGIFILMKSLHESGVRGFDTPLMMKVSEELALSGGYDKEFIDAIKSLNISDEDFELYLSKLIEDSTKFRLYNNLIGNTETVFNNADSLKSKNSDALINKVQADMLTLSMSSSSIEEPKHIKDGLDDYVLDLTENKKDMMGISTGYPILDQRIDGLVPSTLTIIAARKKMGKSALLTNIATFVAVHDGGSVLYIDTEMSFHEWRDRVLSIISGVPERTIKHGGFGRGTKVYEKVMKAVELLKSSKLFHIYMPGYTVDKVSALFKKYHMKEGITLGVFDYIKEPDSSSVEKNRKEYQILGDVTTKLKDLAGKLNIPFLAAVQLNRSGDVADSDRVARYGDVVAFWGTRDKKMAEEEAWDLETQGYYQLSIKDSRRGGRTGTAGIGFQFYHTRLKIQEVDSDNQIESFRDDSEPVNTGNIDKVGN